jgi:iron complex outermembrane receptor protein
MNVSNRSNYVMAVAAVIVASFAGPGAISIVNAQQDAEESSALSLDEIVVTARKRDEKLLDAPLTITVLTEAEIEIKGIDNFSDIVDFAPGFFYGGPSGGNADRSSRRLLIRGMQPSTDRQTRQSATVYVDGAPVLGAEIGDTAGAERIEIIKGPQSAYFGRSSFGGAINVITKTPGHDWQGKVSAEAGQWDTSDFNLEIEGGLIEDKLAFRASAGQDSFGGQYLNYANQSEMLGARQTTDFSLTLHATPTENFTAKLRFHYWEDDDGESPSVAFGLGLGADEFNCNLGGEAGPVSGVPGTANVICGEPRSVLDSEVGRDSIVTEDIAAALRGEFNPGTDMVLPGFLDGFGLYREAFSSSLIMDWNFSNGMSITSITAAHTNDQSRLGDFDYRVTGGTDIDGNDRPGADVAGIGDRTLEDFSQEVRLSSSPEARLQWMLGVSYSDIEENLGGAFRVSAFRAPTNPDPNGPEYNTSETTGFFGSASYDFTDQFTLSIEARAQDDKIGTGFPTGVQLGGTFSSFTPRIILDYKPSDSMTVYGSYAEGNHPGVFNANMAGLEESNPVDFACVDAAIYSGVEVPEETLDNFEVGFKGLLWDGRAEITAAAYYGEWRDQHNRGETQCLQEDGSLTGYATTGLGGSTDISGVELEFRALLSEHLMVEATFALNDTEILERDSNDGRLVLGQRELAGLGNQFSRYPRTSGTLSGSYERELTSTTDWFARLDYIFKDGTYATDANITKTQGESRINLRVGVVVKKDLRLEAYVTNLTDDDGYTGLQAFNDLAFFGGRRVITLGLPVKRTVGIRATYRFDFYN